MAADTAFKRSDFYSIASFCSVIVPVGQSDEEIRERERAKRASRPGPKFVPQNKTVDELFDPTQQIAAGPLFQDNYGIEHDRDIVVTTSDGQPVNLRLVKTFEECNFSEQLLDNIRGRNYTTPMQIQKAMIPLIRQSKLDVMAHAQTGGGKTAAFLLPMIDEIQKDYIKGTAQFNGHTPYVIIIEPTRELVRQLFDDAQTFARGTSVSVTWAYGDTPIEFSVRQLRKGCDILVTTMGRLRHYLEGRIISLEKLRFLVLDEADKFLQFEDTDETFQAVKTLAPVDKDLLPKHRTLLFSATFMASRMRKFLRPEFLFVRVRDVNTAVNTVSQKFLEVKLHDKTPTLLDLLKKISTRSIDSTGMIVFSTKKTIVFKNGRRECDRLGILLATHGFQVITLNSTRTMPQRVDAMDKFTRGVYHILVATDVAARGLNIPNVEYVFNYDLPAKDRPLQYIHRIGRSGRAGNIGHSISFFNRYSEDVVNVDFYVEQLELSNQPVPEFLLDIVEQQREFREQGRQFEYDDEHAQRRWSDDGADGKVLAIEVAVPMPTLEQPQPGFSGSQSAGAVVSYDDDKW